MEKKAEIYREYLMLTEFQMIEDGQVTSTGTEKWLDYSQWSLRSSEARVRQHSGRETSAGLILFCFFLFLIEGRSISMTLTVGETRRCDSRNGLFGLEKVAWEIGMGFIISDHGRRAFCPLFPSTEFQQGICYPSWHSNDSEGESPWVNGKKQAELHPGENSTHDCWCTNCSLLEYSVERMKEAFF